MSRSLGVLVLVAMGLVAMGLVAGCGDDDAPASIDAIVSDEAPGFPEPLDALRLTVTVLSGSSETPYEMHMGAAEVRDGRLVPWQVRISPRNGGDVGRTLYRVRASGLRGGVEVVSTQHRLVFVPGRRLVLALRLDADCVGTTCGADQRCSDALCEDDFIPACTLVQGTRPDDCRNGNEPDASTMDGTVPVPPVGPPPPVVPPPIDGATPLSDGATPPDDGATPFDDGGVILDAAESDSTLPDSDGGDEDDAAPPIDSGPPPDEDAAVPPDASVPDAGLPCTAEDCDDGNPCTTDDCTAMGCSQVFNDAACNDGSFCNGADTCSGGTCSVHAGNPCGAPAVCSEAMDRCVGCATDEDCGPDVFGEFGACGNFESTCDELGTWTRTITEIGCETATGSCIVTGTRDDTQDCVRPTSGNPCSAGGTCIFGECCGDTDCTGTETGASCGGDCCDSLTPCNTTRTSNPSQYCRSINGGSYDWITEAQAGDICNEPSEICATSYACGGESGFCVLDGIYTYRAGPCGPVCGNGSCDPGESGSTCGSDCCDFGTDCGATFGNMGSLYCRSFNGGSPIWLTAQEALDGYCSSPAHVGITYSCVGESGFCCSPGVFAPTCP